ncbi:hypothetical protein KC350_g30 [Hortaea werneckii]|nr:hypothetical protein KC350_g30 [Hortaea werneckii]
MSTRTPHLEIPYQHPPQHQQVVSTTRPEAGPPTIELDVAATPGIGAGFWHNFTRQVEPVDPNGGTGRRAKGFLVDLQEDTAAASGLTFSPHDSLFVTSSTSGLKSTTSSKIISSNSVLDFFVEDIEASRCLQLRAQQLLREGFGVRHWNAFRDHCEAVKVSTNSGRGATTRPTTSAPPIT